VQFNQINYFLRSCDTLNFTRAAEICCVSQPSLSAAIKKLEEELGGPLFERSGRAIALTPLGESMRTHLGQIEQAKHTASIVASDIINSTSHVVNIGLMCTLGPRLLATAISSFTNIAANTELLIHDVWEHKALELLVSGSLDCVIMAHTTDLSDRYEQISLAKERMVLAMNKSHPFAEHESITLAEMNNVHYVDRLRCEFREKFFDELQNQDLSVNVVMRTEREDLVRESVTEDIGISIMPESVAQHAGLETVFIEGLPNIRNISVVKVKDRVLNSATEEFIQQMADAYKAT